MKQKQDIKVLCAWCNSLINEGVTMDGQVSHGICPDCHSAFLSDKPQTLKGFLDQLETPVLVVEDSSRILFANNPAVHLFDKTSEEIHGELGGDLMECENSRKPGGCGNTLHCKACAIRRSVKYSSSTGEALYNVPVRVAVEPSRGVQNIRSRISTIPRKNEKGESVVFLTIRDYERVD